MKAKFTLPRTLLILLGVLYGYFRYEASSMERADLPRAMAQPIVHEGDTLMTFQNGDEDGQPVIFVHGTPGLSDNWAHFLYGPKPGIRVIAIERPGFGKSTPSKVAPGLREQASALEPLLRSLAGRRPILVGHSLGGPVVCQAAVDYPELVGAIVVAAASLSPSVEIVYGIQYFGDLPGVRYIVPQTLRNSNYELIRLRRGLEKLAPRLALITCPVSILHGTEDMLVPFENVAYMTQHFRPEVIHETFVLEGENHFLPWTAQDTIWDAVEGIQAKLGTENTDAT